MKKVLVAVVLGVALVGCGKPSTKEVNGVYANVQVVEFEGHEYLSIQASANGVVHSESCPCKSK